MSNSTVNPSTKSAPVILANNVGLKEQNYGFSFTKTNSGGLGAIIYMMSMAYHYAESEKMNFYLSEEGKDIPRLDGNVRDISQKHDNSTKQYPPSVLFPNEDINVVRGWHSYFKTLTFTSEKNMDAIWPSTPKGFKNKQPDFYNGNRISWYAKLFQEKVYILQDHVQQLINSEVQKSGFQNTDIVIHIRRTDKIFAAPGSKIEQNELNIKTYFDETMLVIKEKELTNPRIFLCTDDKEICLAMQKLFQEVNIPLVWDERETSLHLQAMRINNQLTTTQAREETITALKNLEMFKLCRYFIGARSSYFFRVGELIRYPLPSKNIKDSDAFGKAQYAEDDEAIARVNRIWGSGVTLWNDKAYKDCFREDVIKFIETGNYRSQLHDERIIVIPGIFNSKTINEWKTDVNKFDGMWWTYSIKPGLGKEISDVSMSEPKLHRIMKNLERERKKGIFSYRFKRTLLDTQGFRHFETCWCLPCRLSQTMKSKGMMDILSEIVGAEVINFGEIFASMYSQGDYLNNHHDKNKGDYTFIISLTEGWKESYGGNTNFTDASRGNAIYKKICPAFGTLIIFKLLPDDVPNRDTPFGRTGQMDHHVDKVLAPANRISYTGWFNVKK